MQEKKKKEYYVSNKELLSELHKHKESGIISDDLHYMFRRMCDGIASRPNFRNYTYIEDMVSEAYLRCLKYADRMLENKKENVDKQGKNNNPFGYFSLVIWRSYVAHIKKEKNYQRKKWNELRKLVEQMEYDWKIKFDFNESITEKMYEHITITASEKIEEGKEDK